jgi:hypothetical protein
MRAGNLDPADRDELREVDLLVADLLSTFIARTEHGEPHGALELLREAERHSRAARDELLLLMTYYEAMRAAHG